MCTQSIEREPVETSDVFIEVVKANKWCDEPWEEFMSLMRAHENRPVPVGKLEAYIKKYQLK